MAKRAPECATFRGSHNSQLASARHRAVLVESQVRIDDVAIHGVIEIDGLGRAQHHHSVARGAHQVVALLHNAAVTLAWCGFLAWLI